MIPTRPVQLSLFGVAVVENVMHTTDKHDLVPIVTLQKVAEWKRFIHEQLKQIRRDQTKEAESRMNRYFPFTKQIESGN